MLLYRSASVLNSTTLSLLPTLYSYSRSLLSKPSISFHSSHSPVRVHALCRGGGGRGFAAGTSSAAAFSGEKRGGDTFLADDSVSWTSLGLSDRISRALLNTGFERPSLVQAGSIPAILSGKDVVVAAETGSGKTHAYLVPLVSRICDKRDDSEDSASQPGSSSSGRLSVILCPNALLCEQVVRMANFLCDQNGEPLVSIVSLCGRQGWPVSQPDIIVSTPAALLNNIETKRNRLQFYRNVKYVVFDEADMLLSGGFLNKVIHLINMFRFDEKQLSRANNRISEVPMSSSTDLPEELGLEDDKTIQDDSVSEEEEQEEEEVLEDTTAIEGSEEDIQASSTERKDWRRIRKIYERSKQYIFVAATLPVNGKKTSGAMLKHMFPDANWISGSYLHCHNPRLKHKWIEVTVDTQVDALMEAVKSKSSDSSSGISRTMVFANTVDAVEAVAKILESAEIECYRYHKEVPMEERGKALADFRDIGGIFVCTDAASRGVDISNVSHVIQADFANSAVDFLHRVGRTARAGQYGVVTSLFTEANRDLADAIIEAKRLGHPVETAFSRKRSFRKKLKKRGTYKAREPVSC